MIRAASGKSKRPFFAVSTSLKEIPPGLLEKIRKRSKALPMSVLRMDAEFESKHPRDRVGRFIEKGTKEYDANLKRWMGRSKVVNSDGTPKVVYHGTIHSYEDESLSPVQSSSINQLGRGVYFTDEPEDAARYATTNVSDPTQITNADLVGKADKLAEDLGISYREAKKAITENASPRMYSAYLHISNPLEIGRDKISIPPREWSLAAHEIGKPELVGLHKGYEGQATGLSQWRWLQKNDATQILRQFATMDGRDGIILHPEATPLTETATHYIVFRGDQIKSATGNSGEFSGDMFDPKSQSMLMSVLRMDAEFESKHPRDEKGRFTSKPLRFYKTCVGSWGECQDALDYLNQISDDISFEEFESLVDGVTKGEFMVGDEMDYAVSFHRVPGWPIAYYRESAIEHVFADDETIRLLQYAIESDEFDHGDEWFDTDRYPYSVVKGMAPKRMSVLHMDAEFESKHPRDRRGRWVEKGKPSSKSAVTGIVSSKDVASATAFRIQDAKYQLPERSKNAWSDDDEFMPGVSGFANASNAIFDLLGHRESVTGENYSSQADNPEVWLLNGVAKDGPGAEVIVSEARVSHTASRHDILSAIERLIPGAADYDFGDFDDSREFIDEHAEEIEELSDRILADAINRANDQIHFVEKSGNPGDKVMVSGLRGPASVTLGELEGKQFGPIDQSSPKTVVAASDIKRYRPPKVNEPKLVKGDPEASKRLSELADRLGIAWDSVAVVLERLADAGRLEAVGATPEDVITARELYESARTRIIKSKGPYDEDDEYLYHVTYASKSRQVKSKGLTSGNAANFQGGYAAHSKGRVFLTEKTGVPFWEGRLADQAESKGEKPRTVVFRVLKTKIKGTIRTDREGTRDARSTSYYVSPGDPQRLSALRMEVAHAPKGGVTLKGKFYPGGQFIPGATQAEVDRAAKKIPSQPGKEKKKQKLLFDPGKKRIPVVPDVPEGHKRLYNASLVEHAPHTNKRFGGMWLEPHVSGWVEEVAHGSGYEGDISDITSGFIYMDDEPTRWIESILVRKTGKRYGEITLGDVLKHGRLNVIDFDVEDNRPPVYRMGDGYDENQTLETLDGYTIKFWESEIYDEGNIFTGEGRLTEMPLGPEPNDWITNQSVDVEASLTGKDLVRFIKHEDPEFYKNLILNQRMEENKRRRMSVLHMEVAHAPKGGVTLKGKFYPGGQFIPGATQAEVDKAARSGDISRKEEKPRREKRTNEGTRETVAKSREPDYAKEYREKGTKSKWFKRWFGDWEKGEGSRVVNRSGEPQETASFSHVVDDEGEPIIVYHGTTHEFEEFNYAKSHIESHVGPGFYFSSDLYDADSNYAGKGPDLRVRLEQTAERYQQSMEYDPEYEDLDPDELEEKAWELAEKELYGGKHQVLEVYLNIRNPVVIGKPGDGDADHHKETMFHIEWPETGDEDKPYDYDNPQGTAVDLMMWLRDEIRHYELENQREDEFLAMLWDDLLDHQEISAWDVLKAISFAYPVDYDNDGLYVGGQIFQDAMKHLGYDGIIDQDVDTKFRTMGVNHGSVHYTVFDPTQVKSVQNQGTFDSRDSRFRFSALRMDAEFEAKHPRDRIGRFTTKSSPIDLEGQYQIGKVKFDSMDGKGSMGLNANINYDGFAIYMTPDQFLRLNPERLAEDDTAKTVDFMKGFIEGGNAIGPPWIELEYDGSEIRVVSHEGRGRMLAVRELQPDVEVPVHAMMFDTSKGRRSQMQAGDPWHGNKVDLDVLRNPIHSDSRADKPYKVSPTRFILDKKEERIGNRMSALRMGGYREEDHPRHKDGRWRKKGSSSSVRPKGFEGAGFKSSRDRHRERTEESLRIQGIREKGFANVTLKDVAGTDLEDEYTEWWRKFGKVRSMHRAAKMHKKSLDEYGSSTNFAFADGEQQIRHDAFVTSLRMLGVKEAGVIHDHLRDVRSFSSSSQLEHDSQVDLNGEAIGSWDKYRGVLRLDYGEWEFMLNGGRLNEHGDEFIDLCLHEFGHILDHGVRAGSKKRLFSRFTMWKAAWSEEIDSPDNPLTEYARSSFAEGFAEFARLALRHPGEASAGFPKCWEFWTDVAGYGQDDYKEWREWETKNKKHFKRLLG